MKISAKFCYFKFHASLLELRRYRITSFVKLDWNYVIWHKIYNFHPKYPSFLITESSFDCHVSFLHHFIISIFRGSSGSGTGAVRRIVSSSLIHNTTQTEMTLKDLGRSTSELEARDNRIEELTR